MRDFNSHNQIWGSRDTNERGRKIENFMNKNNLCLLNNKSPSYLHPATGTHSVIDLILSDPTIYVDYNWKTNEDNCGSDHYLIILERLEPKLEEKIPCWNLQRAKWEHFKTLPCQFKSKSQYKPRRPQHLFHKNTPTITEKCIPKSSLQPKFNKPWYNNECKKAVRTRHAALRKFKTYPTKENLEFFKNCRARAPRTTKEAKRETWKNFTLKINTSTKTTTVWNMILKKYQVRITAPPPNTLFKKKQKQRTKKDSKLPSRNLFPKLIIQKPQSKIPK